MSKGSTRRPMSISYEQYVINWESVFGKRKRRRKKKLAPKEQIKIVYEELDDGGTTKDDKGTG